MTPEGVSTDRLKGLTVKTTSWSQHFETQEIKSIAAVLGRIRDGHGASVIGTRSSAPTECL